MNKPLAALGAVAIAAFATQAMADQERWPRWYLGLSGGVAFLDDSDISGSATGEATFDTGGMGTLALGYMPPGTSQPFSNMRFEAELGYHYNGVDNTTFGGEGNVQAVSYMGNVYYDFRNASQWTPYFGGGLGGATVRFSEGANNDSTSDTVFAWQLMGGVAYAPATMPMTEWILGYRYFVADSPESSSSGTTLKFDDYTAHNVEIGGRFRF